MRGPLAAAAMTIVLALVSTDALAKDPPPRYADLPSGRFTAPPKKVPSSVGARESVKGLYVRRGPTPEMVTVSADPPAAQPRTAPAFRCFVEQHASFRDLGRADPDEWEARLEGEATGFTRAPKNLASGTFSVHEEEFVPGEGGAATLEVVDAIVDPNTRGARSIARTRFPLTLVQAPGFGMKIYAGRDDRPDGKRFVQFVAVHTFDPGAPWTFDASSTRLDGEMHNAAGCRHVRVAVQVLPGNGDAATITSTVLLSPPGPPLEAPEGKEGARRDLRMRAMNVHVSVSQTAADPEPVVAISASWNARENVARALGLTMMR